MKNLGALLLLTLVLPEDEKKNPFKPDPTAKLVVHEWGVASLAAGADRQLLGASGPADDDLPPFITQLKTLGQAGGMTVRQPIVYFYADKPTDFSAHVRFPGGYPICFDPPAQNWANTTDYRTPANGYLGWQGRLDPASKLEMPMVPADHWVAHCRNVDASTLTIGSRAEKYLFYEGVVNLSCPATLEIRDGKVVLDRKGWTAPATAVRVRDGKAEVIGDSPEAMLTKAGLYEKEAAALLAIWRDHFLKREGLRLLTLVTGDAYDALLPISICPRPVEMKRVLVLCIDFPTPELQQLVDRIVERLDASDIDERDAATGELLKLGPVAAAAVAKHVDHGTLEMRARVRAILEKLKAGVPVPGPAQIKLKSR